MGLGVIRRSRRHPNGVTGATAEHKTEDGTSVPADLD
jgi:hypothetical protein